MGWFPLKRALMEKAIKKNSGVYSGKMTMWLKNFMRRMP